MGLRDFDIIPAQGEESSRAEDPGRYVEELSQHKAVEVYRRVTAGDDQSDRGTSGDDDRPVRAGADPRFCVIGADTIVVCDGKILGKPADRADAAHMIRLLQGRSHEVMTGVSLIWFGPDEEDAAPEEGPRLNSNSISMCRGAKKSVCLDEEKSACPDGENTVRRGAEDAGRMLHSQRIGECRPESCHIRTFHVETMVHVAPMDEEEIRRYLETGEADDKAGAYGIQGAFGTFIEGIEGDYYNVVGLPIARLYQEIRKINLSLS